MNKITYFGLIVDKIGATEEAFNFEDKTVEFLKSWLFEKYPNLKKTKFQLAINLKIVDDNYLIKTKESIAVLPPFAGG